MATCYRHPNRETNVSCSRCGNPICPSCMTPTSVGMRCPDCAGDTTPVRTAANIRSTSANAIAVTVGLIAINVVAFLASGQFGLSNGGGSTSSVYNYGFLSGGPVATSDGILGGVANGDYWRLVTYGFLHAGLLHIGFNMFLLYILGQMLEPVIGHYRFAAVYAVSLLGGAFVALLLDPNAVTVGASGAIFGIAGAAAVDLRGRRQSIMEAGIGGLILFNLAFSFIGTNISIGGHIGGLVFGAATMFCFLVVDRRRLPSWTGYAAALALGAVAVVAGIAAA
jgi:membrane associated rhomboid family serine protease